jgi:hypothetical protein
LGNKEDLTEEEEEEEDEQNKTVSQPPIADRNLRFVKGNVVVVSCRLTPPRPRRAPAPSQRPFGRLLLRIRTSSSSKIWLNSAPSRFSTATLSVCTIKDLKSKETQKEKGWKGLLELML